MTSMTATVCAESSHGQPRRLNGIRYRGEVHILKGQ
jgi:hypothetical protein